MTIQPSADRSAEHRRDISGYDRHREIDKAGGWLEFSVILLGMAGVLNLIAGIAAIGDSKFYVRDAQYVIGNLHTWGWVATGIGAIQILVAYGIFQRSQAARWVGVFALALNAIGRLLMMDANPLWSLSIFALDLIALYGLIVYGQRPEPR